MIAEMKELVGRSTNQERLEIALKLEQTAAEIRKIVAEVRGEQPASITPAQRRYCKLEGIPVTEFKRKLGLR